MYLEYEVYTPDGMQYTEQHEVPDDFLDIPEEPEDAEPTLESRVSDLETDMAQVIAGLEALAT